MIIDKYVNLKVTYQVVDYYNKLDYNIKVNDVIKVKVIDLPKNSNIKLNVQCDICGSSNYIKNQDYNKVKNNHNGVYMCIKCSIKNREEYNLKKYGYKYIFQNKKLMEECIYKKYGVKNYSLLDNWNDIYKESCQKKYGVDNVFQLYNIKEKIKKANLEKYEHPYHFQNKKEKEKYLIGEKIIDGKMEEVMKKILKTKELYGEIKFIKEINIYVKYADMTKEIY